MSTKNFIKKTLDYAKFNVEYFDDKNKSLGNFEKMHNTFSVNFQKKRNLNFTF
jgi:hypothetical protein